MLQTEMFIMNENNNEKYNNKDCVNVMSSDCENLEIMWIFLKDNFKSMS